MTAPASGEPLVAFLADMRRLRAECSWKREQTHRSLARYLLEETHETLEAIDSGDLDHLCEELGDLLLQVYFHAVIAEERGAFTIDDVARGIIEKMRRRNPHVFAPQDGALAAGGDAAAVNDAWQEIKAREKPRARVTDGLPHTLPALLYADKVLDRLRRAGRPVTPGGEALADEAVVDEAVVDEAVVDEAVVDEAVVDEAVDAAADLGDRLLALVAEAQESGVDPEQALRDAVRRL
jgi:XTP/dITP diphosphohydrolase